MAVTNPGTGVRHAGRDCVIEGLGGCLLCFVTAGAGVVAEADAAAPLRDVLAEELRAENARLRAESAWLREELARRDARIEELSAELAVLKRLVLGRSPSGCGRTRRAAARMRAAARAGIAAGGAGRGRGLTRSCPGSRWSGIFPAPGPPKAIGKGLLSNGFLAMLFTERYVAGRSQNSLVAGLARHGAQVAPATLAGACAQAGALLAPLEEAIAARSRDSWHLHADETVSRSLIGVTRAAG